MNTKFQENEVVVALSHMDDDYAYVFGVGPYTDAFIPNIEFPFDMETGSMWVISETGDYQHVWEFQSQFFTKDAFRKFIGDRKVKRVHLDAEVIVGTRDLWIPTSTLTFAHSEVYSAILIAIQEKWEALGVEVGDATKFSFVDDGLYVRLKDLATGQILENPPEINGMFEALRLYADASNEFLKSTHRSQKQHESKIQSKEVEGGTVETTSGEVSQDVEHAGQVEGHELPKDNLESMGD